MADEADFSDKLPENKVDWQKFWTAEMSASCTSSYKKWVKRGEKIDRRFRDDREMDNEDSPGDVLCRLNLFNSNVTMLLSMLYGRMPKVEVSRRFSDADDDASRVAGVILTRMLNNDIESSGEDMSSVFRSALQDRFLPGLGTGRVRYEMVTGTEEVEVSDGDDPDAQPPPPVEVIADEWTDIVYTHWQDVRWSPARTHGEIRWKAFRSYMGKRQFRKRFPEVDAEKISFNSRGPLTKQSDGGSPVHRQCEVWEIWHKETGKCFWWSEDAAEILDIQDDPLELEGFFPEPVPMVANVTTSRFLPKSDYDVARDLYQAIDELETRIQLLTEACKLVGVYDKNNDGIKRIFNEGVENELIPVDNWAAFAEKGGIKGTMEWLPIKEVAEVIQILTVKQEDKVRQLMQVTGMSDVMRGSQMDPRKSAAATKAEASFGSIRIEALQNDFARWVTDLQKLKVEIISKHYQIETIIRQSNILMTPDAPLAEQAIALIKDRDQAKWRIVVRPESLSIADYDQLKMDRSEFLLGVSQFMQSAAPLLQLSPMALPVLMRLLKWFLAGFRGSSEIEGVLDSAIAQFEKSPPKNDKPDPQVEKMKMEMQLKQQEHAQKMEQGQQQFQLKMQESQQKFALSLAEMREDMKREREKHELEMQALFAKLGINIEEQRQQFIYNAAEREHEAKVQVQSGNKENGAGSK